MPSRSPLCSVNDFVVRFANVNGSGSASANELFARAVLRMGVPVSARNIFPSNIQGLPTWYQVRVCEDGHLGARGRDWVLANVEARPGMTRACGLQIKRADKVGDRIYIEGNQAAALGAVYGGATVCAWYPLTPSSSLADAFTTYCAKLRHDKDGKAKYAIIQGEDEIAAIGIVVGAGWNRARAFTATSGPGISLMQEFCGLAYFAEIPAAILDLHPAGTSTGMPTRTQRSV